MFKDNQSDHLALMYRLFKLDPPSIKHLLYHMQTYIIEKGKSIVMDPEYIKNPVIFTQKLLDFKKEIDTLVDSSFKMDIAFQKCRDNAFQTFMNDQEQTPNMISAFCDNQMRHGFKGLTDNEVIVQLDCIVKLFCCLNGRDLFIKSYTKYFGYRLLNKSYLSKDNEELMLQRLKVECGHNTVNKLG